MNTPLQASFHCPGRFETLSLISVYYSKELESTLVIGVDNEKALSLPTLDRVGFLKLLLSKAQGQNLEASRVLVLNLG